MTMFRLYLEILNFNVGLSALAVVAVTMVSGQAVTLKGFIFLFTIQVLVTSLVFILREVVRLHDARIAARVLAQRTGTHLLAFQRALCKQRPGRAELRGGLRTWNS
jgi:hypothetical protein